jgi:serine/threonine protein kinase
VDGLVNHKLGGYTLVERLGGGGMGTVYRARHRSLPIARAIKVLKPPLNPAWTDDAIQLFQREARLAAKLEHAHIVRVFDIDEQAGLHYIVMELLQGQSLAQLVKSTAPLPLDRALRILDQIAQALDFAHRRRIVHRDLKPANVFIGRDDHVTLLDFGLGRAIDDTSLTITSEPIGTPHYMAPETIDGRVKTAEHAHLAGVGVDLYALGVTTYELLAGVPPFFGLSRQQVMDAHRWHEPPPLRSRRPDLSDTVAEQVTSQLAKEPSERYLLASDFVQALRAPQPPVDGRGRRALIADDIYVDWRATISDSLPLSVILAIWDTLNARSLYESTWRMWCIKTPECPINGCSLHIRIDQEQGLSLRGRRNDPPDFHARREGSHWKLLADAFWPAWSNDDRNRMWPDEPIHLSMLTYPTEGSISRLPVSILLLIHEYMNDQFSLRPTGPVWTLRMAAFDAVQGTARVSVTSNPRGQRVVLDVERQRGAWRLVPSAS